MKVKVKSLSPVWLLATPWTAAHQAPPPMGFSRQEYWTGVPLPSPVVWQKLTKHCKAIIFQFKKKCYCIPKLENHWFKDSKINFLWDFQTCSSRLDISLLLLQPEPLLCSILCILVTLSFVLCYLWQSYWWTIAEIIKQASLLGLISQRLSIHWQGYKFPLSDILITLRNSERKLLKQCHTTWPEVGRRFWRL